MKTIFSYTSFREYLRDFYSAEKRSGRFSYREFSRLAGFTSPNFTKLVIDGVTRISPRSCARLCKACGLKGKNKSYFEQLVSLDQAKTVDAKMSALARMQDLRAGLQVDTVKETQAAFYDAWHHSVVREIISILGRADASEVAPLLMPALKEKQVRDSIDLLSSLKMIEQDAQGMCRPSSAFLTSGAEVPSTAVRNFQREMGLLGVDALFSVDKEEREVSGATFCMSEKSAAKLKAKIQELRREALRLAQEDPTPERVFRLNLQLFPVSKPMRHASSLAEEGQS